jgi:hypothetical protein
MEAATARETLKAKRLTSDAEARYRIVTSGIEDVDLMDGVEFEAWGG